MPVHQHNYVPRDGLLLPIRSLYLLGPKAPGRTPIDALVDSGAYYSVFHRSAAEDVGIGLPLAPNFHIKYGSGISPGWKVSAHIELDGRRINPQIVFVDQLPFAYSLLGRFGVFTRYNEVSFVESTSPSVVEFRH